MVTGIVLTPILPLAMARAAVTAPLSAAVADALRLRDREGASAFLGLSAWVGAGPFIFLFQNGSPVCILAWSLMPTATQVQMTWLFWWVAALPLAILIAVGMLVALHALFRPRVLAPPDREPLRLQRAVLGPLSRTERAVAIVVVLTLLAWIVGPRFVIDPGLIGVASFLTLTIVTGTKMTDLARLDWGYLIFFGVALSLSNITTGLRLDRALGEAIAPRLIDLGITGAPYVLLVAVVTVLVRSVLQADQAILLLSLAFIPVATALNVHPWLAVIAILALGLSWHVTSQTPEYLVARVASDGRLYTDAQSRRAAFAYIGVALAALVICMAYWRAIGLL
jgi:di/tricarboxylate transporter